MLHPMRTTQTRKTVVSRKTRQNKEAKNNTTKEWKRENKEKPMTKKESTLEAELLVDLDHGSTPSEIFQTVTRMNELLEIIVTETNKYFTQKGPNSETTEGEMKAFLGINFIMGINKLPSSEDHWSTGNCIGNEKIQNVMTRPRFQSILQNLHFSINDNDDKADKRHKVRPVIKHLNKELAESLSNSP